MLRYPRAAMPNRDDQQYSLPSQLRTLSAPVRAIFTLRTPTDAERATVKRLVRKAFLLGTSKPSRSIRRAKRDGS